MASRPAAARHSIIEPILGWLLPIPIYALLDVLIYALMGWNPDATFLAAGGAAFVWIVLMPILIVYLKKPQRRPGLAKGLAWGVFCILLGLLLIVIWIMIFNPFKGLITG